MPGDVLLPVHNIVARTEHCVQRTLPVRTVFLGGHNCSLDTGGGGGTGGPQATPSSLHKTCHCGPVCRGNSSMTLRGARAVRPPPSLSGVVGVEVRRPGPGPQGAPSLWPETSSQLPSPLRYTPRSHHQSLAVQRALCEQ